MNGGEQAELNHALLDIATGRKRPWEAVRPGVRVRPLATEEEQLSQAPTPAHQSRAQSREPTPAPEPRQRTPTPGPRPVMVPEAVPEEEVAPETRKRRRRRAAPGSVPDWRRPPQVPDAEAPERPAEAPERPAASPALALVRRARAWRARHGASPDRVTPAAYDAVDVQARFGLIERPDLPQPWPGQTLLVAHTPPRRDPAALLDLRPGDTVSVLSTRAGAAGWAPLRVQFVTRSHYFAPGRPVTSVVLGVRTDEWAHALRGRPPAQ